MRTPPPYSPRRPGIPKKKPIGGEDPERSSAITGERKNNIRPGVTMDFLGDALSLVVVTLIEDKLLQLLKNVEV
jgi:hypothetical protein